MALEEVSSHAFGFVPTPGSSSETSRQRSFLWAVRTKGLPARGPEMISPSQHLQTASPGFAALPPTCQPAKPSPRLASIDMGALQVCGEMAPGRAVVV